MPLTQAAPDALSRIYATAIFDLARGRAGGGAGHGGNGTAGGAGGASGTNRVEEVLGELEDVLELARSDAKFGEFLASRILPTDKRAASIEKIFKGRVSDETLRFLLVLNEKERLGHLPSIVTAMEQMVQEAFGRVEVDVFTAAPIDPEQVKVIHERLQAILKREPVVHTYTQPAMIGGLKLQIGDQLIDASVQTRLRKMREQLTQMGAADIRARADGLVEG